MSIFDILELAGGLAMFLYGMRIMGDGLKESSSGALKRVIERVTNNPFKAFILGMLITALIQSSTATIVITSGLVGAGILTLHQSLGIIVGANVGTTITGQILRLLDVDGSSNSLLRLLQPSSLAPIALLIGIVLIMSGKTGKKRTIGNIAMGFGILFSGLMSMTNAVDALTESPVIENLFVGLGNNPFLGYLAGAGVAFVLQSSSATVGILQAFSQSGLLTFKAIYAIILGIYLGDCVTTAIVCSIGAKAEVKRVGIVNVLYNIGKSLLILVAVLIAHQTGLLNSLWNKTVNSGMIANTNTIFNLGAALVLLPTLSSFEKMSKRIVKDDVITKHDPVLDSPYKDKIQALSPAFFSTPALALRSCYDVLLAMFTASKTNIQKAMRLLENYDPAVADEIMAEEENIDLMTDRVSRYLVELLPNLHSEENIARVNQYYKVVAEFERLGDHAVNIRDTAADMAANEFSFSTEAYSELRVMEHILDQILENAQKAFEVLDVDAALKIEPLRKTSEEMLTVLSNHHFERMSRGECNIQADAGYINLLNDMKRIADVCSNVGAATVIRTSPELANTEHNYYDSLHQGDDSSFNSEYARARKIYLAELEAMAESTEENIDASTAFE